MNENNKFIAHELCQNSGVDKDFALKCLEKIALRANEPQGLNDSPQKISRLCNVIIRSDKISKEFIPEVLSVFRDYIEETHVNSFLEDAGFITENIKPDYYIKFMRNNNEQEKFDPSNYKPEKITDEIVAKYDSIKNGIPSARDLVRSDDSVKKYSKKKSLGYYWNIETVLRCYQSEIRACIQQGMDISKIAQKFNTTEDCINALLYLKPNQIY